MVKKRNPLILLTLLMLWVGSVEAAIQDDIFSKMVEENDAQGIQRAIEDGYDVNRIIVYDRFQYQPLAIAVHRGQLEVVRVLLESGADPNSIGMTGSNALFLSMSTTLATESKRNENAIKIFKMLLSHGANPNCFDQFGITPLGAATVSVNSDKMSLYLIQKLLEAGADVNLRKEGDITPLCSAIYAGYEKSTLSAERSQIISLLLSAGADPNVQDEDGATSLHVAVFSLPIVEILVDAGANPEIGDKNGLTALDWAKGLGPMYEANKDVQSFLQNSEKK